MIRFPRLLLHRLFPALLPLLVLPLLGVPLWGQTPEPEEVLGWDFGEQFTDMAGIEQYMRALADASDLVTVEPYGTTPQGRSLLSVVIARPDHRADLEGILERNRELMDPDTPEERASEIARTNPAVVWFTYGLHGNESASPEAALWTARDLAAGHPDLEGVLDSVVVIMDPSANPDGRDRYVHHQRSTQQLRPNANAAIRERREPWPGSRTNHYLFDLNRDWAWVTQSETRDRLQLWHRWNPQVHVDFHEMGYTSSYFFFPAATPINDIFPDHILEWGERFGDGNAQALDREGLLYYTRQNFDLFYPGYGDSWPSLVGAIGMTYEQGGGGFAGLRIERPDGTILTLRDRAFGHRTTGMATLRTTMEGKTELLEGFARYHREIDDGLDDTYLVPGEDPHRFRGLVEFLRLHDIQVERLQAEASLSATPHPGFESRDTFPAGTVRVPARQPRGRLAGALLRPDNPLDGSSSYDITAWALPYAHGVEAHSAPSGSGGGSWAQGADVPAPDDEFDRGSYGYLLHPSFGHAQPLVAFMEAGGRAQIMSDTFRIAGDLHPRGTIFLPRGTNEDLDDKVRESGLGSFVLPVSTGLSTGGIDLGSNDRAHLRLPRLALLGGDGTSANSFGMHWHFLERILDMPFDILELSTAGGLDLEEWDVIVAPAGNISGTLGSGGMERLERWVRGGGTLVAIGSAANQLGGALGGVERRTSLDEDDPDRDERLRQALMTREERQEESWLERIPGTILPGVLDPAHPMSWGAAAEGGPESRTFVLSSGSVWEPSNSFESVGFYPEDLDRISGVISQRNLERMDRGAWLVDRRLGSGRMILFADDPLFRGFWHGGRQLYRNAILVMPWY
ncbi:MAG: hypothetical protein EA352_08490 [Gemmatimonadales bacterium]|nr:MAG: hypothetical protein EA352_08490 [Gemmatimonadales bacterium]